MKKESMRMKKDIRAYEYEELQKELERLGEKPFRAKQIYEWLICLVPVWECLGRKQI